LALGPYLLSLFFVSRRCLGGNRKQTGVNYLGSEHNSHYVDFAKSSLILEISETELRAGPAHIELKYLGQATALDSKEMGRLRTRDADPASFLIFRFWRSTGVKVEIKDPRDQTPYWLITSKRNKELAEILNG